MIMMVCLLTFSNRSVYVTGTKEALWVRALPAHTHVQDFCFQHGIFLSFLMVTWLAATILCSL